MRQLIYPVAASHCFPLHGAGKLAIVPRNTRPVRNTQSIRSITAEPLAHKNLREHYFYLESSIPLEHENIQLERFLGLCTSRRHCCRKAHSTPGRRSGSLQGNFTGRACGIEFKKSYHTLRYARRPPHGTLSHACREVQRHDSKLQRPRLRPAQMATVWARVEVHHGVGKLLRLPR